MNRHHLDQERARIQRQLAQLEAERARLEARLAELDDLPPSSSLPSSKPGEPLVAPIVTAASPAPQKVALFRRLFAGRVDVFPVRWENRKTGRSGYAPACANEWVKGVCGKPKVKCGECPSQAFIPVSDEMIERHLRGGDPSSPASADFVAGVFPLLADETCWFLAADFDGPNWAADAKAVMETCKAKTIPAALERSRSGNGGHIWIFFDEPISARRARQLGGLILTETMERRPEVGFSSYDRLFPSQDTMPAGGFGNLIALPLQGRARQCGNSVFVGSDLQPYEDQWAFLSSVQRLSSQALAGIVGEAETQGRVLAVRMPVEEEDADEPWRMPPSRNRQPASLDEPLPDAVDVVLADQVYVDRRDLPHSMMARLMRLASFQNPEFYRAQAMRLPVFGKPRIISCAEIHPHHAALPRGCLDEAAELIRTHGSTIRLDDRRMSGAPLPEGVRFTGELQGRQAAAFEALRPHDFGVLAATTAFGKTIIACALIAERGRNTLVLVHRRELLTQWVERLRAFLDIDPKNVGAIGGGRRKPSGIIDVALIQSLVRKGEVSDLVADYGHLVVDECHHLSAVSFELVARRAKARHVLGLSATVTRKDGHHPIIFMQCGPVRHRVDARMHAAERGLVHRVEFRPTQFRLPAELASAERPAMPAVYAALANDEGRNDLIFDDVLKALERGRSPVLLTERRDHLEMLQERLSRFVRHLIVLRGGMSAADRKCAEAAYQASVDQERLVLATGRYLGEGFDDPRLDTLFLTMPISWKGTLAQYVGRLHRQHHGKREVIVYDYVDGFVPMLERMAARRRAGYRALGYIPGQ